VLKRGDDLWLMKGLNGNWYGIGGTARQRYSDGDFGKLLSSSGYQKFPSGLIVQWGVSDVTSGALLAATLPIAFPNQIFCAVANVATNAATAARYATAYADNLTQIKLSVNAGTVVSVFWFAIGE